MAFRTILADDETFTLIQQAKLIFKKSNPAYQEDRISNVKIIKRALKYYINN